MALTRKLLKGMGLTDEQVDTIIEAHSETVDGLKQYKADAEKLPEVQKQLDKALGDLEAGKKDSWKVKYDALKEEHENYKTEQGKKETRAAKEKAYRELLKTAGVNEKRIDAVLKVSDLEKLEMDENGAFKDAETLTKNIKSEWAEFITTPVVKSAPVGNPPANNGGSVKTKEEIMSIRDGVARRKAMAENPQLFGIAAANTTT